MQAVLAMTLQPPIVVTDCLGLLDTAAAGARTATAANSSNARVWAIISEHIDGQLDLLRKRLIWLPAHQTATAIGHRILSNGREMTAMDWRANRLVDKLAQKVAWGCISSHDAVKLTTSMRVAARHACALLGVVTHAANNHKVVEADRNGVMRTVTKRDAQEPPAATTASRKAARLARDEKARVKASKAWIDDKKNTLLPKLLEAPAVTYRRRRRAGTKVANDVRLPSPSPDHGELNEGTRKREAERLLASAAAGAPDVGPSQKAPRTAAASSAETYQPGCLERVARAGSGTRRRPTKEKAEASRARLQKDAVASLLRPGT